MMSSRYTRQPFHLSPPSTTFTARWKVSGESDSRTDAAVDPLVADEGRLFSILVRHWDMPIPRVAVEREELLSVPDELDAVVHAG